MKLSIEQIKEMTRIASHQDQDLPPITTVKYVRIGENDFRFAKPDSWTQHTDLVGPNEIPVSAGFFVYYNGEIHMSEMPSTTLKMKPLPEDKKLLEELFK